LIDKNNQIDKRRINMSNLYEMTLEQLTLLSKIEQLDTSEENYETLLNSLLNEIEKKEKDIKKKVKNYILFINRMRGNKITIATEIDRLKKKWNNLDKTQERLLKNLTQNLVDLNLESIEVDNVKVNVRRSKRSNIIDENSIPKKYIQIEEKIKIKKKEIREDLLKGIAIEGAEIIENKYIVYK